MMINKKQQSRPPISSHLKSITTVEVRDNGSLRVAIDFSKCSSKTKPEFAKEANINNIVKLPLPPKPAQMTYADLQNPPDMRQVFDHIYSLQDSFMSLPSDIRKLLGNDPANLQSFVQNPLNKDLLVSRGLLIDRSTKTPKGDKESDPSKEVKTPAPKGDPKA